MDTQVTPMPTGIIQNNSTSTSNVTVCPPISTTRRQRIKAGLEGNNNNSVLYWLVKTKLTENLIEFVRKYDSPKEELQENDKEDIERYFMLHMDGVKNNNEKIEKIISGDYVDFLVEIVMFLRAHSFCLPKSMTVIGFFETLHNVVNCALVKTVAFDPELYKRATFEDRHHLRRFSFLKEEIPCPTREESATESQTAYFSSTPGMK